MILACAAWKDKINMEDTLFAGAVIEKIGDRFDVNCDASKLAFNLYQQAKSDLFGFMQVNNASHFQRLMGFGLEGDIRHCFEADVANVLPVYKEGRLVST